MDLKTYQKRHAELEKIRRRRDQSQGALNELLEQLRKEHGCSTIEEADELLEQLRTKLAQARKKLKKQLKKFDAEWTEYLEELGWSLEDLLELCDE